MLAFAPPAPQYAARAPAYSAAALRLGSGLAFGLFLFLNFVLYVRPTEIIEPILGFELYLIVILLCLVTAFPVLLQRDGDWATWCVVGLTGAVFFSQLANFRVEEAFENGIEFFKVLLYFLLFKGLVTDKLRLRRYLWWLTIFITISAIVSLLDFYGMVTLPIPAKVGDVDRPRLRGTGIFNDPNDLCVLLCLGLMFGGYFLSERRGGPGRVIWLLPLGILFFALLQTQSRGGLVALMLGVLALLRARWGWARAVFLAMAVMPALLIVAGERQASISSTTDTGQKRIELWSDGLMMFRENPLFGVGSEQYHKEAGQVAHNSYLHAFAETGVLGGALFLGAFVFALLGLERLCPDRNPILDPELRQMQPYVLGGVASYLGGMTTLSLTYMVPTFGVLALATAFVRMSPVRYPMPPRRFDLRLLGRMVLIGILFMAAMLVFVRFTRF